MLHPALLPTFASTGDKLTLADFVVIESIDNRLPTPPSSLSSYLPIPASISIDGGSHDCCDAYLPCSALSLLQSQSYVVDLSQFPNVPHSNPNTSQLPLLTRLVHTPHIDFTAFHFMNCLALYVCSTCQNVLTLHQM